MITAHTARLLPTDIHSDNCTSLYYAFFAFLKNGRRALLRPFFIRAGSKLKTQNRFCRFNDSFCRYAEFLEANRSRR